MYNHLYGYILDTSAPCTFTKRFLLSAPASTPLNTSVTSQCLLVVLAEREPSLQGLVRVASDMRLHQRSMYRGSAASENPVIFWKVTIAKSKHALKSIGGSVKSVMIFFGALVHCIVPQWEIYHRLNGKNSSGVAAAHPLRAVDKTHPASARSVTLPKPSTHPTSKSREKKAELEEFFVVGKATDATATVLFQEAFLQRFINWQKRCSRTKLPKIEGLCYNER